MSSAFSAYNRRILQAEQAITHEAELKRTGWITHHIARSIEFHHSESAKRTETKKAPHQQQGAFWQT
jgi:hypothetical protein